MSTSIITAVRTIVVEQRAVIAMDLTDTEYSFGAHNVPEDAWTNVNIREVRGANVQSILEYDDPQGRFEFVTGATVVAPKADFLTDASGVTTDMRGAN